MVSGADGEAGTRGACRRCSEDSCERRAAAEARQAGRAFAGAVAGGRSVSADMGSVEGREGSAAAADSPLQAGAHPCAGEERPATSGAEPGTAEEKTVVERSGTEGLVRVAAGAMGQPAARRPVENEE